LSLSAQSTPNKEAEHNSLTVENSNETGADTAHKESIVTRQHIDILGA
jgi:hypothetical protein